MRIAPTDRLSALPLLLILLSGCPEDATVTHSRIARTAAPVAPTAPGAPAMAPQAVQPAMAPAAAPSPAPQPGMAGEVPAPPKPVGGSPVVWTLPKDWSQTLTGGIRYATIKAPAAGDVDISVVVLAGPAGGELANVNRWRSQIGLAPLTEETLPSSRKSVTTKLGPLSVYDFTSEGSQKSSLVAGILSIGENTWFFKMTGNADAVAKARPGFEQLLQSLRPAA